MPYTSCNRLAQIHEAKPVTTTTVRSGAPRRRAVAVAVAPRCAVERVRHPRCQGGVGTSRQGA